MDLIRFENICKTYHLGEVDVPVLRGVSLTIKCGEMVALKRRTAWVSLLTRLAVRR